MSINNIVRQQIRDAYRMKAKEIKKLEAEMSELNRQDILLSDDKQWYVEQVETIGRGKNKRECLVGRIYWKEDYKDEDSDKVITIDRSRTVRMDGEWIIKL